VRFSHCGVSVKRFSTYGRSLKIGKQRLTFDIKACMLAFLREEMFVPALFPTNAVERNKTIFYDSTFPVNGMVS
jgi:hypothetical protein